MALGAVGAWILSRSFSGMLFETTASDPLTFLGMLLVLGTVSAIAGYLPARRASRIDPSVALRAS
jgi:ABC-type antimicrobial peptide transport system permease subunit